MVRIKDISDKCGVSLATVSKALNGHPDISSETTRHIKSVAEEMGYLPNAAARALKTNKSYSIAVLFVDKTSSGLKHEYFSYILDSVKVAAERLGYDITFASRNLGNFNMSFYEHAKYRNCDGVIIASVDFYSKEVVQLVESEIPVVTIDHIFNNRTAILSDNIKGVEDILDYVYKMGHRKIAFIHGEDTAVTQKRVASFYRYLKRLGVDVPAEYVKTAPYHDAKASENATKQLLALPDPPTCILYPDDFSYLGGKAEIESRQMRIPEDISVVGYDGIYLSRVLQPVLTTYRQNSEDIGRLAAEKLIEMIENPKMFIPEQVLVKGQFQEGGTVKNLNA
jgi:LacI family transcriptional regulator